MTNNPEKPRDPFVEQQAAITRRINEKRLVIRGLLADIEELAYKLQDAVGLTTSEALYNRTEHILGDILQAGELTGEKLEDQLHWLIKEWEETYPLAS